LKRGEIWEVNLDPALGAEIKKICPCVLVGRDALARLPLKIIVPLITWRDQFSSAPWHILVTAGPQTGLSNDSSADTYQVRSIAEQRLIRKIGELEPATMDRIDEGLVLSLGLDR
jgi:mRNA interferase MazF